MRTLDEVFAVCRFMADFPTPWWLGGGWAIEVWAGSPSREHEDIEICVLRGDQELVYTYCAGWQFFTPVDNEWAPMAGGERLLFPRFMLQLRRTPETAVAVAGMPPEFEFLLNDLTDGRWIFHHEPSIRLPLERVYGRSPLGLPVTAPEVLLLHKAWYHRPKDDHDFAVALPRFSAAQRAWLRRTLEEYHPGDPWLASL